MKKQAFWLAFAIGLFLLLGGGQLVQAAPLTQSQVQQTKQWYRDPQGVVGPRTQQALYTANYRAFAKIKGKPQIAVIVTSGKDEDELQDYANEQFKKYGFGHARWDNGLLLTIEPKEHHYWMEVGYGLEPVVPDGSMDEIVSSAVKKQLRASQYDQAIAAIVTNTVCRVQKHQDAISTPAGIAARRAHDQMVQNIGVGMIIGMLLLMAFMAARFFALRNWAGRIFATQPGTFPILQQLHDAGIVIDPMNVPGGGWALFNRQQALAYSFAKLIRRDYIKWLAKAPQLGPLPFYYYKVADDRMTPDKWPAAEMATEPSLAAILTDETPRPGKLRVMTSIKGHTDVEVAAVGQYQDRFDQWLRQTKDVKPKEASQVWQDFFIHAKPEDANLSDEKLAQLWTVMLTHQRNPMTEQSGIAGMPVWVVSNYVHASAPSSGSGGGFGAGGGGGASGGGGFGGSW
ncbi:TPM domain-containing protein [Lacticaseibacillus jixianensis]|uniref:TPM domain-containing protein n=1 Tax=Lacticaseibacillus jixianensis TaxID=2486012 RepID=A0ABW4B9H7_9LACO|nr:TPM domain-containing protein [Lacticaseibacillus jixianensis]